MKYVCGLIVALLCQPACAGAVSGSYWNQVASFPDAAKSGCGTVVLSTGRYLLVVKLTPGTLNASGIDVIVGDPIELPDVSPIQDPLPLPLPPLQLPGNPAPPNVLPAPAPAPLPNRSPAAPPGILP